jgi:hypothetical protein
MDKKPVYQTVVERPASDTNLSLPPDVLATNSVVAKLLAAPDTSHLIGRLRPPDRPLRTSYEEIVWLLRESRRLLEEDASQMSPSEARQIAEEANSLCELSLRRWHEARR